MTLHNGLWICCFLFPRTLRMYWGKSVFEYKRTWGMMIIRYIYYKSLHSTNTFLLYTCSTVPLMSSLPVNPMQSLHFSPTAPFFDLWIFLLIQRYGLSQLWIGKLSEPDTPSSPPQPSLTHKDFKFKRLSTRREPACSELSDKTVYHES